MTPSTELPPDFCAARRCACFNFISIFTTFLTLSNKNANINKITLKTCYLFAFLSPCMDGMVSFMDGMVSFYNGIQSHIIYVSFSTFILTF